MEKSFQPFSKRRCSSSFFQSEIYLKTGINSRINPKAFLAVHINIFLSDCVLDFITLLCLKLKKNAIHRHRLKIGSIHYLKYVYNEVYI